MTRRRWALLALGAMALVWALGGEWATIHSGVRENHFLDAVVGLSFLGGGIVALDRRPGNAIGPLMIAYGFTWFVGNWSLFIPVFPSLAFVTDLMQAPILVHIALSYPSGRLRTSFDRFVVGAFYVTAGVIGVVGLATFPRRSSGCACPWTPLLFPNRAVFEAVNWINDRLALIFVPLVLSAVVLRWRRASGAERRDLTPLWIAGTILALVFLVGAFASADTSQPFPYLLWELRALLEIAVPIIFVWGVLSTRLARSAVGDLVVELERIGPRGDLEAALAHALGDRSLEVAYALEGEDKWVDAEGLSVSLPVPGEGTDRRAVTLIERDGVPLAALIHDPALDQGLVRAAGAAAGMAIANEQLRAEVRAQLEEVRASRERIVEAGDRERRRVERNLHDGAQQRLVTLSLALAMLRERPDSDPSTAAALGNASVELKRAIGELRELARGIHPAILTEEGLLAAVESLADRSSVPVRVRAELDGRLPEPIEATAYFVVGEALANVAKYADASGAVVEIAHRNGCLTVEVGDDGRGGADPGRGTGIRGLEDRVSAVGGTLRIDSPPGKGTRISVEIPT